MADGGALAERPWWRRPVGVEVLLNAAAIVVIPLLARATYSFIESPFRGVGVGQLIDVLAGGDVSSDIGLEVASARGLVDGTLSMYDPAPVLAQLIGFVNVPEIVHTHPPTSMVLWIPLAWLPYHAWLSFFLVASVSLVAASMRLLDVPAWAAYPIAVGTALFPPTEFGLMSTYPLAAALVSLAWRYRDTPAIAGPAYALLAAGRGVTGVLLLYPLFRRQWRTVGIAVASLAVLLAVAVIVEPDSVRTFVDVGRQSIAENMARSDLFTAQALTTRRGLPGWVAWLCVLAVGVAALALRREPFWVLVWLGLALAPLAWVHTSLAAIPLFVVIYRSGTLGKVLTLLTLALALGPPIAAAVSVNVVWAAVVLVTGIGILACPATADPRRPHEPEKVAA